MATKAICSLSLNTFTNKKARLRGLFYLLAEWTGLEPATPGVTGRYSNQLNYHSELLCLTEQTSISA